MESSRELPIDWSLQSAVILQDKDAALRALARGANPHKVIHKTITPFGEAARLGNVDLVKLFIYYGSETGSENSRSMSPRHKHVKCCKRKLRHSVQQDESVAKCKALKDRNYKDYDSFETCEAKTSRSDKNQGYFIFTHSEGSSSDESKTSSLKSPVTSSSLTPSPQADLEWDEDIVNVAPTTSEDETWSTMYKWYASILENTGPVLASASLVTKAIDKLDGYKKTALHYAAEEGHTEVVRTLIEAKCKLDIETTDGFTALHLSVINHHTDVVNLLILAGANVNPQTHKNMTPLHYATSKGFLDLVEILVTNGAKLGARDVADRAALHFAASAPNVEILRYLIDAGADVNCEDGLGSTLAYPPICEAVWHKHPKNVELLLSRGARITHSHRLLHNAVVQRQVEIVKLLATYSGGANLYTDNGDTPFLLAARLGEITILQCLLQRGANPNCHNSTTGANCLHLAIESMNNMDEFEILLRELCDHNIDIDSTALTADTPLNRAMILNKDGAAVLLIRYGADVNKCQLKLKTLKNINIAKKRKSHGLASMLLKAGHYVPFPDPNEPIPDPSTAAHWLYYAIRHPLSLSDLCRIQIRNVGVKTTKKLYRYIQSLPIPRSLKEYLLMVDEGLQ
ncbi:serine/threonine-protein phosphatase 6 regulatory ankyrin repeat subunit B-like isoform X2 [Trichoplusia ni]|uniref:Serine/threonine-protein phosphatase 6 regulatory ankyrin repeat subunit B-like isoform X2 n=1 Tax=Trichoplusia ni TaxID=7111 RepID=A0A7E5WCN3_TRINI|nr:serine/threonine-protein phosphatase 6 regulatory ankyrin repeat subunit B-like isoform X2 [Trichoplusia ni]